MWKNSAGRVWVVFQYDLLLGAWTASYHVNRICFATRGTKNSKGWTRQWFQRFVVIVLPWKLGTKWFSDREDIMKGNKSRDSRVGRERSFDQRLADDPKNWRFLRICCFLWWWSKKITNTTVVSRSIDPGSPIGYRIHPPKQMKQETKLKPLVFCLFLWLKWKTYWTRYIKDMTNLLQFAVKRALCTATMIQKSKTTWDVYTNLMPWLLD